MMTDTIAARPRGASTVSQSCNKQGSISAEAMGSAIVQLLLIIGATLAPAGAITSGHKQPLEQSISSLTPDALADYVPSLPCYGKLDFGMFSG